MATSSQVVQDMISLVESEGPEVLGSVLSAVCPACVPVAALVDLSAVIIKLIEQMQGGSEQQQVAAAAATVDATVDTAEATAVSAGLVK